MKKPQCNFQKKGVETGGSRPFGLFSKKHPNLSRLSPLRKFIAWCVILHRVFLLRLCTFAKWWSNVCIGCSISHSRFTEFVIPKSKCVFFYFYRRRSIRGVLLMGAGTLLVWHLRGERPAWDRTWKKLLLKWGKASGQVGIFKSNFLYFDQRCKKW